MWQGVEPPSERRSAPRLVADGQVEIDGQIYGMKNWSLNGAMIDGVEEDRFAADQEIGVSVRVRDELSDADEHIHFDAKAVVVRMIDTRLHLRFALVERDAMPRIMRYFMARGWLKEG